LKVFERIGQFFPGLPNGVGRFLAIPRDFIPHRPLRPLLRFFYRLERGLDRGKINCGLPAEKDDLKYGNE